MASLATLALAAAVSPRHNGDVSWPVVYMCLHMLTEECACTRDVQVRVVAAATRLLSSKDRTVRCLRALNDEAERLVCMMIYSFSY